MRAALLALSLLIAASCFASDDFPYVFQRGKGSILRVQGSIESFTRIAKRWSGQYIWVRVGGRDYLIRDAAVLAAANAAFAEMDAMQPQVRAADARYRPIAEKFEAIEDDEDHPNYRELERAYEAAEREVERLEDEMERREAVAEKKFEKIVLRAIDGGKAQRVD